METMPFDSFLSNDFKFKLEPGKSLITHQGSRKPIVLYVGSYGHVEVNLGNWRSGNYDRFQFFEEEVEEEDEDEEDNSSYYYYSDSSEDY